jgi:hypothetical protein
MVGANGSVSNTAITGVITGSQLASPLSLSGNLSVDSTGTTGIRAAAANTTSLYTAGVERMRINSTGLIGMGTTDPTERLDVRANATFGSATDVDASIHIQSGYDVGIKYLTRLTTDYNGVFSIRTGSTASANTPSSAVISERMRINNSGDLMVNGTTSYGKVTVAGSVADSFNFASNSIANQADHMRFLNAGTTVGSISRNGGSATSYLTSSDYRLKKNVTPMTGALNTVALLKPVTYKWKLDDSDGQGFIAHELAEVVPDAVNGIKDAVELVDIKDEKGNVIRQEEKPVYQGVDTSFLVATLTAAIQEQQAIIDDLKARIEALEA